MYCCTSLLQASLAVDSLLSLKDELIAASVASSSSSAAPAKVLFAIDDYSALHWRTGYGQTDDGGQRVPLQVADLTLVSDDSWHEPF